MPFVNSKIKYLIFRSAGHTHLASILLNQRSKAVKCNYTSDHATENKMYLFLSYDCESQFVLGHGRNQFIL